jgi:protein-tyrosine phosphatase
LRWIDLHSHILPGVDDGPTNMEDSIRMAREAVAAGCEMAYATPHAFHASDIPPRSKLTELSRAITGETGLPLVVGYEVHILAIVEGADPRRLCLGDSNILLVELPLVNEVLAAGNYLSDLVKRGFTPLLAHPERYYYMKPSRLRELAERGVRILLNSNSFAGVHGRDARKRAEGFLREGLVDALASDAHAPGDYTRHAETIRKMLKEGSSPELFAPEIEGEKKHEHAGRDT